MTAAKLQALTDVNYIYTYVCAMLAVSFAAKTFIIIKQERRLVGL